jgi:hypothetical protein
MERAGKNGHISNKQKNKTFSQWMGSFKNRDSDEKSD